jgi:hypothetical protein
VAEAVGLDGSDPGDGDGPDVPSPDPVGVAEAVGAAEPTVVGAWLGSGV